MEQARANNRQGLPVGAQYLTEASAGLRAAGGALTQLDATVTANRERVQQELDAAKRALLWLVLPGLLALLVLAGEHQPEQRPLGRVELLLDALAVGGDGGVELGQARRPPRAGRRWPR